MGSSSELEGFLDKMDVETGTAHRMKNGKLPDASRIRWHWLSFVGGLCMVTVALLGATGGQQIAARVRRITSPALSESEAYLSMMQGRFERAGIPAFLSMLRTVTASTQPRTLVLTDHSFGLSDRIKGIPMIVALAYLSNRRLVIQPSLFMSGQVSTGKQQYILDCGGGHDDQDLLTRVLHDPAEVITVSSNYYHWEPFTSAFEHLVDDQVQAVMKQCADTHLCGAAAVHTHRALAEDLMSVYKTARALMVRVLSERNYTVLHIRTGASQITIQGTHDSVPASAFWDALDTSDSQAWIDAFAGARIAQCEAPVALISDSSRVVGELQHLARDALTLVRCCSQPMHVMASSRPGEFPFQVCRVLYCLAPCRSAEVDVSTKEHV
jgi:hypothetical protein